MLLEYFRFGVEKYNYPAIKEELKWSEYESLNFKLDFRDRFKGKTKPCVNCVFKKSKN